MPLTSVAVPSWNSFVPAMSVNMNAVGAFVAGLSSRSKLYFTSSAVMSRPFENLMPSRKGEGVVQAVITDFP